MLKLNRWQVCALISYGLVERQDCPRGRIRLTEESVLKLLDEAVARTAAREGINFYRDL
jgi:hypothetical protein